MHAGATLCCSLALLRWLNVSSPDIQPCLRPVITSQLINPNSINVRYLNIMLCVCGVVRGGRPAGWMMMDDTRWKASSNHQDLLSVVEQVAEEPENRDKNLPLTYYRQYRELFSSKSTYMSLNCSETASQAHNQTWKLLALRHPWYLTRSAESDEKHFILFSVELTRKATAMGEKQTASRE